jgi:hypothetical protein
MRRRSKKKRMRRPGILMLAALAALILGFMAKHVMIPSAVHYIAYRPPDQPAPETGINPPPTSEQLTPSDRSALDTIIKQKDK